MPTVVVRVGPARAKWWRDHMQALLPDHTVVEWDAVTDPDAIDYAVVWKPPPGGLKRLRNLKLIVSIAAGVDHIFADPDLPAGVPIARTVGEDLRQRMVEYVCLHVLRFHRNLPEIEASQASASWDQPITPPATRRRVGVMGLGNMGVAAASALAGLGFDVAGWARSPREVPGLRVHTGAGQLDAFLADAEILVCLLPLTPETDSILCADLFARLPRGAALINAGRGEHLVEEDLIPALDSGQLRGATLDVFRAEPLPTDHPFWRDPRILVTPHTASLIDPEAGGRLIADTIRRFEAGGGIAHPVDPGRGY